MYTKISTQLLRRQLSFYWTGSDAPHYHALLRDTDGVVFLDYVWTVFGDFPYDGPIHFDLLRKHKDAIERGLTEQDPGVRDKYRWMAGYHNFACRRFVRQFSDCTRGEARASRVRAEADQVAEYAVDGQYPEPQVLPESPAEL